jgi:hypothetical protein
MEQMSRMTRNLVWVGSNRGIMTVEKRGLRKEVEDWTENFLRRHRVSIDVVVWTTLLLLLLNARTEQSLSVP